MLFTRGKNFFSLHLLLLSSGVVVNASKYSPIGFLTPNNFALLFT